jgi:hypothetical protein
VAAVTTTSDTDDRLDDDPLDDGGRLHPRAWDLIVSGWYTLADAWDLLDEDQHIAGQDYDRGYSMRVDVAGVDLAARRTAANLSQSALARLVAAVVDRRPDGIRVQIVRCENGAIRGLPSDVVEAIEVALATR